MNLRERLAEALQAGLPLTECPYRDIAEHLSSDEETILRTSAGLIEEGIIRSFGAFVDFGRLGYEGVLCGLIVPEDRIDGVASILNGRREVTHNYLRNHEINLWCTALLRGSDAAGRFAEEVLGACGCSFVLLGTEERLKLRPTFRFSEEETSFAEEEKGTLPCPVFSEEDLAALALLQNDFPVVSRPFDEVAQRLKTTTEGLLVSLDRLRQNGILRRIGASLNHRRVGYGANALVAWDAEDSAEAGRKAAQFPWVSHCYLRKVLRRTLPFEWPCTLYTMLHARDATTLDARIREMKNTLTYRDMALMPTTRELKKERYLLPSQ